MNTIEIAPIAQSQWQCIAGLLKDELNCSRFTASVEPGGRFVCRSQVTLFDWVPSFLFFLLPTWYCEENRSTIQYLFTSFGRERIVKVCRRFGLDINDRYEYGTSLSKRNIEEIFIHLAYVYKEDMIQIFTDIQRARGGYLHLAAADVERLQNRFRNKEFSALDKGDLDEIYKVAVPFTRIETIFLNKPPINLRSGNNKGGDFWETRKVVYFSEWIRRRGPVIEGRPHLSDYYALKQLLGPFTPYGLVIPDQNGYRYVWRKEEDGGMMRAVFLQTLTQGQGESFNSQIAFLSTQFFSNAYKKWGGWLEDFRLCMGSHAIIAKFDEWKGLLNPSQKGFLRNASQGIEIIGYSLGGVHAQRLACALLPTEKVKKLTTVCSPGVDSETAGWYRKNHSRFSTVPNIYVVKNKGDCVGDLGDEMLGSGCKDYRGVLSSEYLVPSKHIKPGMSIQSILAERVESTVSWFWGVFSILESLLGPHSWELLYAGGTSYNISFESDSLGFANRSIFVNKGLGYEEARRSFTFGERREFVNFLNLKYPELATA